MPRSSDLIREFTEKNHVEINGEILGNVIARIFTNNVSNETREKHIRDYIENLYSQVAEEFERKRALDTLYSPDTASKTTSFEFFDGYLKIISEIARETSDRLIAQAEAEKVNLRKAVNDAKKAFDDAEKEHDTRVQNYKDHHNGSTAGIENIPDYKKYKDDLEIAKIRLDNAESKQLEGVAAIDPFNQSNPYFGMDIDTVNAWIEKQVKTCNYMDLRREQIERFGIRSNSYALEIENSGIPDGVTYKNATVEQKRKFQEIYATKRIMQEKLEARTTGAFAWFKKWWYRKDISALNNYLFAANLKLNAAGFNQDDAAEALENMTEKGFFHYEYKASGAAMLSEKVEKIEQIDANKDKNIAAASQKDALSQMFDVYFRAPVSNEDLKNQITIANQLSKEFVQGNTSLDPKAKSVFSMNMKKLKAIKTHFERFADPKLKRSNEDIQENYNQIINEFEKTEREFIIKNPDYVPLTLNDIQKSMTQREPLSAQVSEDIKENVANTDVSQPVSVEEPVVKKEEIALN